MAYTTKVITDTSPDFDSNPKTITEDGFPYSVEIGNLDANTGYYTKAEIWQDGTLNDTSEVETFQTLKAGSITLTFVSTVRNGDDYVVTYTVASTYALSSAILTTNNTNFQGAISGNSIVFTVSGLTQDNTYLYNITAIDIYAETGTADGRITTEHDYSQDYFTITNTSNGNNTIGIRTESNNPIHSMTVDVSTDNGSSWTSKTTTLSGNNFVVTLATLAPGSSLLIRHTGTWYPGAFTYIESTASIEASGNVDSLVYGDNFLANSSTALPNNAYMSLFDKNTHIQSARNLVIQHTNLPNKCMESMFQGCTSLTTAPDLSSITSVGYYSMRNMFRECTSLTTAPDLSNINSVGDYGMWNMFRECTSLTTMPDLSNVVSVGSRGMEGMFYQCDRLVNVSDFDSLIRVGDYGFQNAFGSCKSLETAPNFNSVATVGVHAFDQLFTWDGNLKSDAGFNSLEKVSDYTFYRAYCDCTSLKTGSDIRRITAAGRVAFAGMYQGCSSLLEAYAPTITWDTSKTKNWLSGVHNTGELYADPSIASSIPTSDASGCPTGWTVKTA